ncbi:hypothetical protein SDC9_132884 [bioreactor metagenome]|uniref:Uncharacterized protein n=1 Tax=bioreactor metagenome TaxID=1076179 RepID=A0A645DB53_9ZZZZ
MIFTHCLPRVTPGLSPTSARFCPAIRLISVDFPTLGMPTIMQRTVLLTPLSFIASTRGLAAFSISETAVFFAAPPVALTPAASMPRRAKCEIQRLVAFGSARSLLLSSTTRALPAKRSSKSGLREASGARASRISTTTSIILKFSCSMRRVFAICPGYQLMAGIVFLLQTWKNPGASFGRGV